MDRKLAVEGKTKQFVFGGIEMKFKLVISRKDKRISFVCAV